MKEKNTNTIKREPIQPLTMNINTKCWICVLLHHSEMTCTAQGLATTTFLSNE